MEIDVKTLQEVGLIIYEPEYSMAKIKRFEETYKILTEDLIVNPDMYHIPENDKRSWLFAVKIIKLTEWNGAWP